MDAIPAPPCVDRDGAVRAIHGRFGGPATGGTDEHPRAGFERLIEELPADGDPD